MADRCPRCGGTFHCGVNDARPCACTDIRLSPDLQLRLRERYSGCLCLDCLDALSRGATVECAGTDRSGGGGT